jgi:hypothetical protein
MAETGAEVGPGISEVDLEAGPQGEIETVLSDIDDSPVKSPQGQHPVKTRQDPGGILVREEDMLDKVFDRVESVVCRGGEYKRRGADPPSVFQKSNSIIEEDGDLRLFEDGKTNLALQESAEEKKEEHEKLRLPPGTVIPLESILQKQSFDEERKEEQSMGALMSPKTGTSTKPKRTDNRSKKSNKDFLDFIFVNAESLLCRDKKDLTSLRETPSLINPDDESVIDDNGTDHGSPIRLHKLATPEGEVDALDYVFDNAETMVCREPTSSLQQPSMESSQLGHQTSLRQAREAVFRVSRSHNLLDIACSEESRLDRIRKKKRQIELQVRSSSSEPGILVPRGYKEKVIPSNSMSMSLSRSDSEEERSKFKKYLLAGLVSVLLASAMILVAVSFFWPTEKL